jgi:hypothetical protein
MIKDDINQRCTDGRFRVALDTRHEHWPDYFENFFQYCNEIAHRNSWSVQTVMNRQLRPHGRVIITRTQGWYLRWESEQHHTMFVLKWA